MTVWVSWSPWSWWYSSDKNVLKPSKEVVPNSMIWFWSTFDFLYLVRMYLLLRLYTLSRSWLQAGSMLMMSSIQTMMLMRPKMLSAQMSPQPTVVKVITQKYKQLKIPQNQDSGDSTSIRKHDSIRIIAVKVKRILKILRVNSIYLRANSFSNFERHKQRMALVNCIMGLVFSIPRATSRVGITDRYSTMAQVENKKRILLSEIKRLSWKLAMKNKRTASWTMPRVCCWWSSKEKYASSTCTTIRSREQRTLRTSRRSEKPEETKYLFTRMDIDDLPSFSALTVSSSLRIILQRLFCSIWLKMVCLPQQIIYILYMNPGAYGPEYLFYKLLYLYLISMAKTRGLLAGRKLANKRRIQRWNDKDYNKRLLGSRYKNPFMGASHAKGLVVEKMGVEAKQPNSAIRKCVRVLLKKNGKKIACFVPKDGCLNYLNENDEVLVAGFGRKGHAVGDIPGVRFKVIAVKGLSLKALYTGKAEKK